MKFNKLILLSIVMILFSCSQKEKELNRNNLYDEQLTLYFMILDSITTINYQELPDKNLNVKIKNTSLVLYPQYVDSTNMYLNNASQYITGYNENIVQATINMRTSSLLPLSTGTTSDRIIKTLVDKKGFKQYEKNLFKDDKIKWEKFYKIYDNSLGLVSLSSIGFNYAKNVAVCYVEYRCHYNCGYGQFFIFKKNKNKWIVIDNVIAWVA